MMLVYIILSSRFRRLYSIKSIAVVFKLSYDTLDVKDGIEAMITYHSLPLLDEKAFNKEYQALIEYCKQDTWGCSRY